MRRRSTGRSRRGPGAKSSPPRASARLSGWPSWLNRGSPTSTKVLVSPAVRCQETAKALGRKFRTVDELAPGASAQELLDVARWPESGNAVLIVGHQPTLGFAASQALIGVPQPWSIKKAGVWWIRHRPHDREDKVILQAVQSPDCL
jgi:phosphohistidine phosphatase